MMFFDVLVKCKDTTFFFATKQLPRETCLQKTVVNLGVAALLPAK